MKKIVTILLVALIGLTGCKSAESDLSIDNTSSQPNAKMGARMAIKEETTAISTYYVPDKTVKDILEINDFQYAISKKEVLEIHTVRMNHEYNRFVIYYNTNQKLGNLSPTGIRIIDGADNVATDYFSSNAQSGGDNLDLTQKKFTVFLQFADNPEIGEVTIEITLP